MQNTSASLLIKIICFEIATSVFSACPFVNHFARAILQRSASQRAHSAKFQAKIAVNERVLEQNSR